jgi:hypothetical protein
VAIKNLGSLQVANNGLTYAQLATAWPAGDSPNSFQWTVDQGLAFSDGTAWRIVYPRFTATSGPVGGTGLVLGSSKDYAVSCPGARPTHLCSCSPQTAPAAGIAWSCWCDTNDVITVRLTGFLIITPPTFIMNVKAFA